MKAFMILMVVIALAACGSDEDAPENAVSDAGVRADASQDMASFDNDQGMGGKDIGLDLADVVPDMPASNDGWQTLSPIATGARQETAVIAYDGKIWVLGGFNETLQIVPNVEVYDPAGDTWRRAADLPVPMHHANAAVVGDEIWVVGFLVQGFAADGRTFIYDTETDAWAPGPDMPDDRRRGSSAVGVVEDRIYVAGGLRSGAVSDFSVLDTSTGTWSSLPDVPRPVDHAAFGIIDGKLVIAGGRDSRIAAHTPRVEIYDPETNRWSEGAAMPTSRGGVAGAVLDRRLFVFGGEGAPNETGVFDHVEAYDAAADRWDVFDPMPDPRHGMGAAAVDGIIYVPGGADEAAFAPLEVHSSFRP